MDTCPDCKSAKISQDIKLQPCLDGFICPECGGMKAGSIWYSASKYPTTDWGWAAEMGFEKNYKTFKGKNGRWRRRYIIKVG